jgi:hypothetical protein
MIGQALMTNLSLTGGKKINTGYFDRTKLTRCRNAAGFLMLSNTPKTLPKCISNPRQWRINTKNGVFL